MPAKPLVAIVDDDPSMRDATSNLLEAEGMSTARFADAESFLESVDRLRPACLLADMRMPGMSGLELHGHLVAAGTAIPTILITAYASDETRLRAREAGIVCCLAKPFAPDELLACVGRALHKPKS